MIAPAAPEPDAMPTIDLDAVCRIILLARQFDAKVDIVDPDPGSNASDDEMREVLEDFADDATADALRQAIRDLNVDEQVELVALAWVGRGSFSAGEWEEAVAEARRAHNSRTAEYLMGQPMLGDLLEEGLAAFDLSCAD
jgi:hypothetical protein